MAMTATISVSPSTVLINQLVNAVITISNSAGSPVNVTGIAPYAFFTGSSAPYDPSINIGAINLGNGVNLSVPASGSLTFPFSFVAFASSTNPYNTGNGTYSISAICNASDGSIFSPTAATVTVNSITLPTTEQ